LNLLIFGSEQKCDERGKIGTGRESEEGEGKGERRGSNIKILKL